MAPPDQALQAVLAERDALRAELAAVVSSRSFRVGRALAGLWRRFWPKAE